MPAYCSVFIGQVAIRGHYHEIQQVCPRSHVLWIVSCHFLALNNGGTDFLLPALRVTYVGENVRNQEHGQAVIR
jgi:hypothetical protein